MDKIFIIGGGPSILNLDLNKLENKTTICVNKSFFHTPNPDYFITMDYTFLRKIKPEKVFELKNSKAKKYFVANFASGDLIEKHGFIIDTRCKLQYVNLDIFDTIVKSHSFFGFGININDFRNGKNSGYCALQLAITLGYKEIYLLGFDLDIDKDKTHFHEGYSTSIEHFQKVLETYQNYFEVGLTEIKDDLNIYSCSPESKLNTIIDYKDFNKII